MDIDHDSICAIIRDTAARKIMPLWRNLEAYQIELKAEDDAVTVADRACEGALGERLPALLPGSLVIGEESAYADPSVFAALDSDRPVWVMDPLDGTNNFAAGNRPFAVMVCLLHRKETLGAWIYDPVEDTTLRAEKGAGAWLGEKRLRVNGHGGPVSALSGTLSTRNLPAELLEAVTAGARCMGRVWTSGCAAADYRTLATGGSQFLFYYSTLIWDHAPGVLILSEAGAVSGSYDGRPYQPKPKGGGVICASDRETWKLVRDTLLP